MIELVDSAGAIFQIAHDLFFPHQEPDGSRSGGGASTIVILAGVVLTLAAVAGLVWVKKRTERADEAEPAVPEETGPASHGEG